MSFSFFKKKEGDGKPDAPTLSTPTAPAQPGAASVVASAPTTTTHQNNDVEPASYNLNELTIEVTDSSSRLTETEGEAVVLYANGQATLAALNLRSALPALHGQRRSETWAMLFELYQQLNQHADFDELALLYVAEFEATPPLWREATHATAAASASPASSAGLALAAQLNGGNTAREVNKLLRECTPAARLQLDLGQVSDIDNMAAAELLTGWQRIRKQGCIVQLIGADSITKLLGSKIEQGRPVLAEAPFWLLLLEMLQASDSQEAFENLAINYAVTYEVSPPSWDGPARTVTSAAIASRSQGTTPATPPSPDRLLLSGALLQGATAQLQSIREFGASHNQPVLDFHAVPRVDFETAGQLLSLFMEMLQRGVVVRLVGSNALVTGLLHLVGIGELVKISES